VDEEVGIYRDEVLDIIGGLADISSDTILSRDAQSARDGSGQCAVGCDERHLERGSEHGIERVVRSEVARRCELDRRGSKRDRRMKLDRACRKKPELRLSIVERPPLSADSERERIRDLRDEEVGCVAHRGPCRDLVEKDSCVALGRQSSYQNGGIDDRLSECHDPGG